MAGLVIYLFAWWAFCTVLFLLGCVLVGWAIRNLRRELGGAVMLIDGIALCLGSVGEFVASRVG